MKILIFIFILFTIIGCKEKQHIVDNKPPIIDTVLVEGIIVIEEEILDYEEEILDYEEEILDYEEVGMYERDSIIVGSVSIQLPQINPSYGTLTYKIDTVLIVDVTSRVEARISKFKSDTISDYLVSISHESYTGRIETTNIRIGNIMDMDLISLNDGVFNINKISPDDQPIDNDYIATWVWGLTPLKTGEYNLILRSYIKDNNQIRFENIFDKIIRVENKPKKNYRYELIFPDNLKIFEQSTILLNIYEDDENYDFQWGSDGKIILEFDKNIKIEPNNNYYIDYNKGIFRYRWLVEPADNDKETKFILRIIGDYEELIVEDGYIKIKRNFNESFNRFVDVILKRWYFLLSSLIIPFYIYIKKKYFKKEEEKK